MFNFHYVNSYFNYSCAGNTIGQNIFIQLRGTIDLAFVTPNWHHEKEYYNHKGKYGACDQNKVCGHYTQVVLVLLLYFLLIHTLNCFYDVHHVYPIS